MRLIGGHVGNTGRNGRPSAGLRRREAINEKEIGLRLTKPI